GVDRLADDAAGHPADELPPGGEEPVVRAAVERRAARALALSDRHRAPVLPRGFEHAERHHVDVCNRMCSGLRGGRGEIDRRLGGAATTRASAATVVPSYPDAFDTSIPVSSQITVWYSKIACRTPWLISGWYGV